jgi:hypothetical protein
MLFALQMGLLWVTLALVALVPQFSFLAMTVLSTLVPF